MKGLELLFIVSMYCSNT